MKRLFLVACGLLAGALLSVTALSLGDGATAATPSMSNPYACPARQAHVGSPQGPCTATPPACHAPQRPTVWLMMVGGFAAPIWQCK
jgi:hypothetical protein